VVLLLPLGLVVLLVRSVFVGDDAVCRSKRARSNILVRAKEEEEKGACGWRLCRKLLTQQQEEADKENAAVFVAEPMATTTTPAKTTTRT